MEGWTEGILPFSEVSVACLFYFSLKLLGQRFPFFLYILPPHLVTKTAALIFYRLCKLSCPSENYIVKREKFQCCLHSLPCPSEPSNSQQTVKNK